MIGGLQSPSTVKREREGPAAKRWEGEGNPLANPPLHRRRQELHQPLGPRIRWDIVADQQP
jgi:hypothetical protein